MFLNLNTNLTKNNMGKIRKHVDRNDVMKLAANGNTNVDIAMILDISVDTLTRRFSKELFLGRSKHKAALRAALNDEAINKRNPVALKHACDRYLGTVENKLELIGNEQKPIVVKNKIDYSKLSVEELEVLQAIAEKASSDE